MKRSILLGLFLFGGVTEGKNPQLGVVSFVNCKQTHSFSDGSTDHAVCPSGQAWNKIHCHGRYCDNIHLMCCDLDLYGTNTASRNDEKCYWDKYYSEEQGWLARDYPINHLPSGMRCKGRYCDNKSILYCPFENVEMEPIKTASFKVTDNMGWQGCNKNSVMRGYNYQGSYADDMYGECHVLKDHSPCPIGSTGKGCQKCHNNFKEGTEECDDSTIACLNCKKAKCGDKAIQKGTVGNTVFKEQCDNGYSHNKFSEDCTQHCLHNICGDRFLHKTKEECEKGPSCTPTCLLKPHVVTGTVLSYNTTSINWDQQANDRHEITKFLFRVLYADSLEPLNIASDKLIAGPNDRTKLIEGLPGGRKLLFGVQALVQNKRTVLEEKWATTEVITSCHCMGDSDAPDQVKIAFNLKNMMICPQWRDRSVCDRKYYISSRDTNRDDSLVQFGSVNGQQACGAYIANTEVCDNLRIKGYSPGSTVSYCIQQELGLEIEDYIGNTERQCTDFMVPWVATIRIVASLDDDSRNIPLVGYTAEIYIGDTLFTKAEVTAHNGIESINVQLDNSMSEYERISIRVSKSTTGIAHDLKCINERGVAVGCESVEVQVKHLSLHSFEIKDYSVRSIMGQLQWEGTEAFTGGNLCPVASEVVCVRNPDNNFEDEIVECEETDEQGFFNFALPIFRKFELFVDSKFDHQFVSSADKQQTTLIFEVKENVDDMNFLNIEKRQLDVQYFGGECKSPLEGAEFRFVSNTCTFREDLTKIEVSPGQLKTRLRLPAMVLDVVHLTNVRQGVDRSFQSDINLYFSDTNARRLANLTLVDTEVTFQYFSAVNVDVSKVDGFPQSKCDSVGKNILQQNTFYNFTFVLEQSYPSGVCKILPDSTIIKMEDKIGDDPECRKTSSFENGCSPLVDNSFPNSFEAYLGVLAGSPNLFAPHKKELHVETRMIGRKPEVVIFEWIVLGERSNEFDKVVFGFPKWLPTLILRRPPGDSSYAEYSRVSGIKNAIGIYANNIFKILGSSPVSLYASILPSPSSLVPFDGIEGSAEAKLESQTCVGVTCVTSVSSDNSHITSVEVGFDMSRYVDYEYETADESTTTFRTSDSARLNSVGADLFLIPNLLLVFRETDILEIFTNETDGSCKLQSRKAMKWAVEPDQNAADAISAVSEYDVIKNVRRLQNRIENLKKVNPMDFDAELNETLTEARDGWKSLLQYNDELKEAAFKNPTKLKLSSSGSSRPSDDLNKDLEDSNMVRFYGGGQSLEQTFKSRATQGSLFRANLNTGRKGEVKSTFSKVKEGLKDSGAIVAAKNINDLGDLGNAAVDTLVHYVGGRKNFIATIYLQMTEEQSETTSTKFVLKDKNVGDDYLVQVFTDPVYGTPVFKTVGGHSKCMHENGTIAREKFDVVFAPGQTQEVRNIRVGSTGFIKIEIHNNNEDGFLPLILAVNSASNPDGLKVTFNGAPLMGDMYGTQLDVYPGKMQLTLAIEQGSVFDYKGIEIMVLSSCEPWKIFEVISFDAYFLEGCAGFDWAGDLKKDDTFVVTSREQYSGVPINQVPITIRRFSDQLPFDKQRRLKAIDFQYRRLGSQIWETPEISEQDSAGMHGNNFFNKEKNVTLEDKFGFALMYWDTSAVQGGDYEIRVRSACSKDTGIEHLDNSYSDIIIGTIDRLPPSQHSRPLPDDGKFFPGETFSISFDEKIDCSKPYSYKAVLDIPGIDEQKEFNSQSYEKGYHELTSFCHDNTIEISLTAIQDYKKIMGQEATMSICNVYDLKENKIPKCIKWDFKFEPVDLDNVIGVSEVVITGDIEKDYRGRRRETMNEDGNKIENFNPAEFADSSDDDVAFNDEYGDFDYGNYDDPENNVQDCINSTALEQEIAKEIAYTAGTVSTFVKILCIRKILKDLDYPAEDERHNQIRSEVLFEIYSDETKSSLTLLHTFSRQLIKDNLREDSAVNYISPHPLLDHVTSDSLSLRVKSGTVQVQDLLPEIFNINEVKRSECTGPFPDFSRCENDILYLMDHWNDTAYAGFGMDGTRCSIQYYLHYYENTCPNPDKHYQSTTTHSVIPTIQRQEQQEQLQQEQNAMASNTNVVISTSAAIPKGQQQQQQQQHELTVEGTEPVALTTTTSSPSKTTSANTDTQMTQSKSLSYKITHVNATTGKIIIGAIVGTCFCVLIIVGVFALRFYKTNEGQKHSKIERLLVETQELLEA